MDGLLLDGFLQGFINLAGQFPISLLISSRPLELVHAFWFSAPLVPYLLLLKHLAFAGIALPDCL